MHNPRVLVVGTSEKSVGGISSVIRLLRKMPIWEKYSCYWLGTQIHASKWKKALYAFKGNLLALCIVWKFDIVHFHTTPDRFGLFIQLPVLLLAKLLGKKTVMHIHVGNQLENHTSNNFFKWWMRRCDHIVLLAQKWKSLLGEKYKDIQTPCSVIYNACEERTFVPMDDKEKYIIFVGTHNPNKSPDLLLEAWAKIHKKFPDWRVKFMGGGNLEGTRCKSVELGVSDTVDILGFCWGKDGGRIFSKASIYAMCSFYEGFPMAVLEAWGYGAAVVTTPVGGLPDVIEENKNCLTFDFGNAQQLAACLEKLICDRELRTKMSVYSRQFVYQHFSLSSISDEFARLYETLLT